MRNGNFRFLLIAALTLIVVASLVSGAFAQDGSGDGLLSVTTTAFLVDLALITLGPLIFGLVTALLARLYTLAGLKQTAENRATVEQVLERAVDLARARFGTGGFGAIPKSMQESAIRAVAEYAIERGPDALKSFGITRVESEALRNMITARMAGAIEDGSGSAPQAMTTAR